MDNDNDFEIIDTENYRAEKDQQFSHQALVMKTLNKCLENGAKEMREGYWNEKSDKFGNKNVVYVPDTRKEFIESVKTAKASMISDFDGEADNNIKKIYEKLDAEFKRLCKEEANSWEGLTINGRNKRLIKGITFVPNTLNKHLPFYQEYLEFEVDCYREIMEELIKLTKRCHYYEQESYEA